MNRAIARRTLFESPDDIRFFQACLGKAVRQGEIEVHAWTALTTHFHLLVSSPVGRLSDAMCRIQHSFSKHFNRGRDRDGPLVRGRFRSKPVASLAYRHMVVRYIDRNPVEAGLVDHPCAYPYGSANAFATGSGPRWLSRIWVEEAVCEMLGIPTYAGHRYSEVFGDDCPNEVWDLVGLRARTRSKVGEVDPLDYLIMKSLLGEAPDEIRRWLESKTMLADGTRAGLPVAHPNSVRSAIAAQLGGRRAIAMAQRRGSEILEVGLLRDLTAIPFREIAVRMHASPSTVSRWYAEYRQTLRSNAAYATLVTKITTDVLTRLTAAARGTDRSRTGGAIDK